MRFSLIGLSAIAAVGAAIAFIGPLFISTNDVRDRLFAQVEAATGYRLRVDGPVHLSMFPSLDLVAEDVGVADGASGSTAEIATAKKLKFSLALRALLGGKIKITEVTLIDPVITVPQAKAGSKAADGAGASAASTSLQNLSLDKLVIENGRVILPPSGGTPGKQIGSLMLQASLPSIAEPLEFDARANLDGEKLHVAGELASLGNFLDGAATPISVSIEAPSHLNKGLSLAGNAIYRGKLFTLKSMTARMGDVALAGQVSADLSGDIPSVTASLAGQTLNLDALLPKSGGGSPAAGASGSAGWSDAKIDFSALRSVNARFAISLQRLVYQQIKAGPVTIQATIAGGKLNATIPTLKLYDGGGSAAIAIDASGKIPAQAIRLQLAGLDGYSFLKDTASFESIDGIAAIALDLTMSGASQRAIVQALTGTAKFEFTDGAIRGINIAKSVRSLSTGILAGWQQSAEEKTDFAALGASFKIAKGQAQTADLHLAGPLVRMTGAGFVDLPSQMLKFRIDPQVVASLKGQGGKADLGGLGVPVIIAGPWAKPQIYPDIEGILQNPQAAYEQLNKLTGGLVALKGNPLGSTGSIPGGIIQNGKINKGALQQGAMVGLGALLGAKGAAEPALGADQQQPADQAPVAGQQPADVAPAQPRAKVQSKSAKGKAKEGVAAADGGSNAKKSKKQKAAQADQQGDAASDSALAPEAAVKQIMLNFLGN